MKTPPAIVWHVEHVDGASVILRAEPLARVIPDGLRVRVTARNETREEWRTDGPGREVVPVRGASVVIVNADGVRDREQGVRFGGTLASGFCSATCEESQAWYQRGVELESPVDYWRAVYQSTLAWRYDSVDDLPDGARAALYATLESAAAFAGEHLPGLWHGAALDTARQAVEAAQREADTARAALKRTRADLRRLERARGALVDSFDSLQAGAVR